MKSVKFLFITAILLLVSNIAFSQSSKANSKAVKKTEKLNDLLKSESAELALNESQIEQLVALQEEHLNAVSALKESITDKNEVKAKSKELSKAMKNKIADILTPEQAKVQKDSRKKAKGKKGKEGKKGKGKAKKKVAMTLAESDEIWNAATSKHKAKAEKATSKLNTQIIAAGEELALSDDQRRQINAIKIKGLLEAEKMEKSGASKEELKKLAKSNKRIMKSVLNPSQKDATKKKK